jgi:hypothetical protein
VRTGWTKSEGAQFFVHALYQKRKKKRSAWLVWLQNMAEWLSPWAFRSFAAVTGYWNIPGKIQNPAQSHTLHIQAKDTNKRHQPS